MNTQWYRTESRDERTQQNLFDKMFSTYNGDVKSFDRKEPQTTQALYHVVDATVWINKYARTTITARTEEQSLEAKTKIEELTQIKLIEDTD